MTRTIRRFLILLIFAFIVKEAHCSSLQTLSNAYATDKGEVPIHRDYSGFYVEVDLDYKPGPSFNTYKMLISLSNNQTILVVNSDCIEFDRYDYSAHNCNITEKQTYFSYPFVIVYAQVASAQINLDYSSWILKTDAYLSFYCQQRSNDNRHSRGRLGVLGLGTGGHASASFISSKTFSIFLNTDGPGSKLLFRYEESLAESDSRVVLHADANWRTYFAAGEASIQIGDSTLYLPSGKLIFDMHYSADSIGLPRPVFEKFLEYFNDYGISCYYSKPVCTGKIENFPKLYLNIGGNSIYIPESVYVEYKDPRHDYRRLNIRPLGPEEQWENWVPNEFMDTIILGANVMNYYYTVFKTTSNTNTISLYVKGPRTSQSLMFYTNLTLIILLVILAIVATVLFIRKKKKQAQAQPNPSTAGWLINS